MARDGLVATPITDKNGKNTTVYKKPGGASEGRSALVGAPTAAAVEAPDSPLESLIKEIGKGAHGEFMTYFVNYDDQLNDDQSNDFLAGSDDFDLSILEAFSDQNAEYTREKAVELCDEQDIDFDDLDWDEQAELSEAINDKNWVDPVADLLKNTPSKLMRAKLASQDELLSGAGLESNDVYSGHSDESATNRVKAITAALEAKGVNVNGDDVQSSIAELVDNGPFDWHEGVKLDAIWYGDIKDANVGYGDGDEHEARELKFTGGVEVLLIDPFNGSGHSVRIKEPVTVKVTKGEPAYLDSKSNGYGWDEVAGLYHPAFQADVESTWK